MTRLLCALAAFAGCYRDATPPAPAAREEPVAHAAAPAPAAPPSPQEPPAPAMCDEVPCGQPNACCDDTRRWRRPPPRSPSRGPATLDRAMIVTAIAAARPAVTACGASGKAKGIVKVRVIVGPDGAPTSVTVVEGVDPPIDACVAAAVQQARFPPTENGGSFSYPFTF